MGKLTNEVFNESCCDGGVDNEPLSCQPCGCDRGAAHLCERHLNEQILRNLESNPPVGAPHVSGDVEIEEGLYRSSVRSGSIFKEIRITDPTTGGQKGQKEERFDLIPNEFERALALHYGKGAKKYEDRNWERGYRWSLSVAALRRHLAAWLSGERDDPETGSSHLIAVAWHAIALFIFQLRGLGTDDITRKV